MIKFLFLQDVISLGAGEPLVSEYLSTINYHSEQPKWGETVKVTVLILDFKNKRSFKCNLSIPRQI